MEGGWNLEQKQKEVDRLFSQLTEINNQKKQILKGIHSCITDTIRELRQNQGTNKTRDESRVDQNQMDIQSQSVSNSVVSGQKINSLQSQKPNQMMQNEVSYSQPKFNQKEEHLSKINLKWYIQQIFQPSRNPPACQKIASHLIKHQQLMYHCLKQHKGQFPFFHIKSIKQHPKGAWVVTQLGDLRYSEKKANQKDSHLLSSTLIQKLQDDHLRLRILRDLAKGLKILLQKGIFHLDLKINNMILRRTEDKPFVLIDYELAFYVGEPSLQSQVALSSHFETLVNEIYQKRKLLPKYIDIFMPHCYRVPPTFRKRDDTQKALYKVFEEDFDVRKVRRLLSELIEPYYRYSYNGFVQLVYKSYRGPKTPIEDCLMKQDQTFQDLIGKLPQESYADPRSYSK